MRLTLRRGWDTYEVVPDARGFQHLASCTFGITSERGSTRARHGRSLGNPHVAMGLGPYLRLTRRGEVAGVWPLRIPSTATVYIGSLSLRLPQFVEEPSTVRWRPFLIMRMTNAKPA
jgi:hypothetical protein